MTSSAAQRYALIAQLAQDYNSTYGRPAGKKALQKLFYVLQRRSRSAKQYQFSFYNYGVYSHDLARDISDAERYDFLHIDYDHWSNAYQIKATSNFEENKQFLPTFYQSSNLGDVLRLSAKELELITTIMFVCDEEKITGADAIASRVKELKPKFSDAEIKSQIKSEFCSCANFG